MVNKNNIQVKFPILVPVVEVSAITDKMEILKSWIDSRSKFLEIKTDESGKSIIWNHETNEIVDSDIDHYIKDVMKMDLAFNYFQNATFKLKTSVLLRDFFYTFNEVKGKWATTQRYSTEKTMRCSSEAYIEGRTEAAFALFEDMTNKFNSGEITQFDQVRECMPEAFQVSYQFSCPVKQFIKMCSALLYAVGEQSEIWREFYASLYEGLKAVNLDHWLDNIQKYTDTDECHKYWLNPFENDVFDTSSDTFFTKLEVGPVLYSQMIRHEGMDVVGYFDFLSKYKTNSEYDNCKAKFPIKFHCSKSRLLQIIKTRTEWFAVYDDWESHNTWAAVLKKFIPEGAKLEDYKKYLKVFDSNGNYDPILAGVHDIDDSLRLHKGYKAYLPNALVLESRNIVLERIKRYGNNPVTNLYLQMFDQGIVKDNPDNVYRKKWESLTND